MTLLHQAAQKAVEALNSCETGGYRDIDGDWCKTHWYDSAMVKAAIAALESALQQQPEPVAHAPQLMTEAEIHAHSWWCPHCLKDVPPEMVTKDGEHYLESGGCGYAVRAEPALQQQEVPREPVARPSMSMYASAADYSAAMDGWIAATRQCPACKGKFGVDGQACDLCNATGRVPSTTRQQEVGIDALALLRDIVTLSSGPGFHAAWSRAKELVASAPSTPEKAGGVSDGVGQQ